MRGYPVRERPLTWAHKVSAAFLIAMTALYVWLVYSAATVDWPEYPTPVVQAPVVETVLFPVVVTETPIPTPTLDATGIAWRATVAAIPTRTPKPYQTRIPTPYPTSALSVPMEGTESIGTIPTPVLPWCLMSGCMYKGDPVR